MFMFNTSPLEEIGADWLRAHLRHVCDQVNFHDARYAVLRRGRPVAGIVPITEARALVEAMRDDRKYREVQRRMRLDDEDRLRRAVAGEASLTSGRAGP